jgi:DNA-binding NarL/FixJ family response regulator
MLKVFIVDDHDTCRLALKLTVLLVKKYEIVGEASSGKDLVEQILEKAPDAAIIDLSLPGKNGFEVFQELRRRGCKAKVIIWTAHMDAKTVEEAIRLDVDGYLCKGARAALMEEALAAVLDGKKWIDPSVKTDLLIRKSFEEHPRAVTA